MLKEFIKNHIALYNHSVSSASNDSVVLMNGKNVVLKSDKVGGASLLSSNKLYQNGVLFTIGSKLNYLSNVFEYIEKDPDLDSLRSFLYNQDQYKFYYREFMPSLSVVDSVKDGQTVYMDSVFRQRNRLFTELDFINEEDSKFWMVAPTNAVWKELIDEYSNYFKYPKNVEYADSMAYTNARLAIVQGTIFSKTTNRSVFENQTSSLTQVIIPSNVKKMGSSIFEDCTALDSVAINGMITEIEADMFLDCKNLRGVSIPASVREIGNQAFQGCAALHYISLPVALTEIGSDAYEKCAQLKHVSIPVGVTSIGSDAFYDCTSLHSVELPIALKKIGGAAFAKCPSLRDVKLNSPTPPSISKSTFKDATGCTFWVPKGSVTLYTADKTWAKLPNIKEKL